MTIQSTKICSVPIYCWIYILCRGRNFGSCTVWYVIICSTKTLGFTNIWCLFWQNGGSSVRKFLWQGTMKVEAHALRIHHRGEHTFYKYALLKDIRFPTLHVLSTLAGHARLDISWHILDLMNARLHISGGSSFFVQYLIWIQRRKQILLKTCQRFWKDTQDAVRSGAETFTYGIQD